MGSWRAGAAVGAFLALVGTLVPWARTVSAEGTASVGGFGHGAELALVLALVALLAAGGGVRLATALAGLALAGWMAVVAYSLPGDLLGGGTVQADLAWGVAVPLVGGIVCAGATLVRGR